MADMDFLAEIRRLNGTPDGVLANPEVLEVVLPAIRADTELCETYEYTRDALLSCPIVAFCGKDDDQETAKLMGEWQRQTTGSFSLHALQGDHFFVHSSEPQLLDLLKMELSPK
jgi:medium-chain acyl-[acyl-carrier-protein] hydrolase